MNLVIDGMVEGFTITDGFGDSSDEPPPSARAPGVLDSLLGDDFGGLTTNLENPDMDETD